MHRIEPEQKSEPELRRATPPGQLLQLITDQRPVPDQLIFIQHTCHEASGSLASTAATSHRKPSESGSILAAHDQPRPGDPPKILSQPAGIAPDLGQRNRAYLVTAVLPTPQVGTHDREPNPSPHQSAGYAPPEYVSPPSRGPRSERQVAVTQRSSARYRHWPFHCWSSPVISQSSAKLRVLRHELKVLHVLWADWILGFA